jgi:uncharacterized protein
MRIKSRSDALWHLADALSEDILNTGAEDLFAEVAEDRQNRRALATEFDRIFRRGLRRVRRQEHMERLQQFIDLPWPSPRFAMACIGALAVIAIASALYLDQPFRSAERQPTNLDSGGAGPAPPIVVAEAPKVAPQAQRLSAASLPDLPASAPTAAATAGAQRAAPPIATRAELELAERARQVERSAGLRKANGSLSLAAESLTPSDGSRGAAGTPDGGDKGKVFSALQYAADQGHLAAQWKVGRMYAAGDGVPHDDLRAFNYFSQIANAHPDEMPGTAQAHIVANAFVALGHYYLNGIPNSAIVQDTGRAREMFAYAASYFGDADAQYQLGRLYLDGTPSDPHQAARWFQLAATKGDCRAEAILGDMLFQGKQVPRQAARGLMWLTLSKDCAGPEENWVKPLYDNAFHHASDDERAMAFVFLEDWLKGRRE